MTPVSNSPIIFRASRAGSCIREIVTAHLDPEKVRPPKAKLPFLNDGHHLQAGVIEFLRKEDYGIYGVEREGEIQIHDGAVLRGHVDGLLRGGGVLEVKAVQAKTWPKVLENWRQSHPQYRAQAHVYMRLWGDHRPYPVYFIWKNRDTGEMAGGFEIDHPAYTFDRRMIEHPSDSLFKRVVKKHLQAAEFIRAEEIPETCDKSGYCFFCKGVGKGRMNKPRSVYLEKRDLSEEDLAAVLSWRTWRDFKMELSGLFDRFSAEELEIELAPGKIETIKKGDLK